MSEIERAIEIIEDISFCDHAHKNGLCTYSTTGCSDCDISHAKIVALTALRKQAERSKGCEWCKALSFNPDIGGCQLAFFRSKAHPDGAYAISVSVFDEYGEEQEPVLVQIDNCIRAASDWR